MILGVEEGTAVVVAAAISAVGVIVGPIVIGVLGKRTRRVVRREAETTREQNTSQHGEGRMLVDHVASSILDLHSKVDGIDGKVDRIDGKVDVVAADVEKLTTRVDGLDGG